MPLMHILGGEQVMNQSRTSLAHTVFSHCIYTQLTNTKRAAVGPRWAPEHTWRPWAFPKILSGYTQIAIAPPLAILSL